MLARNTAANYIYTEPYAMQGLFHKLNNFFSPRADKSAPDHHIGGARDQRYGFRTLFIRYWQRVFLLQ